MTQNQIFMNYERNYSCPNPENPHNQMIRISCGNKILGKDYYARTFYALEGGNTNFKHYCYDSRLIWAVV